MGAPKRILLLGPPNPYLENSRSVPRLGLLQLGTILKQAGHAVKIVQLRSLSELVPLGIEWDWIGISSTTREYPDAVAMLNYFRREGSPAPIVIGGPHATAMPDECYQNGFNAAVGGEADEDIARIVRGGGSRYRTINYNCGAVPDLDTIPIPDRTLLSERWQPYVCKDQGERRIASLLLSRGCPYKCSFCGPHPRYRRRGIEHIKSELDALDGWGYKGFVILDDLPFVTSEQVFDFCDLLPTGRWIWRCNFRTDLITETIAIQMKAAGCRRVQLGIESASQPVLNVAEKKTTPQANGEAVKMCQGIGLPVKAMFVWGLPGDDENTAQAIIDWVEMFLPVDVQIWQFTPMPGSPLWNDGYGRQVTDYQTPWFHSRGEADKSLANCVGNDKHTAAELWTIRDKIETAISKISRIDRGVAT